MQILQKPVRNFSPGRKGERPIAVVLHIAEGSLSGAYAWFNDPASKASSHYMIGRQGQIWQFVKEEDTAWHAGGVNNPTWSKLKQGLNPNLYTIGIEHEGRTGERWTESMHNASAMLIAEVCKRWSIPVSRQYIIGHNEINSSSRANCPGNGVDFAKLIQAINKYYNNKEDYEDPAMIKELQEKITQLEAAQRDHLGQIKSMQTEIAELKKENAKLKNQPNPKNDPGNELKSLREQNTKLSNEVAQLQNAIQSLRGSSNAPSSGEDPSIGELLTSLVGKVISRKP